MGYLSLLPGHARGQACKFTGCQLCPISDAHEGMRVPDPLPHGIGLPRRGISAIHVATQRLEECSFQTPKATSAKLSN